MLEANAEKYILFEDKDIIVCRKPAGIAVQNARIGAMDLESGLKNYLASAGNGRQIPYLAVVHRLDQPVEGVLVFARNPKAARNLSAQITAGKMEKIYLAVTFGRPAEYEKSETARSTEADSDETRSGKKHEPKILEDYLKKDGKTNTSSVVSPGTPVPKRPDFLTKCWTKHRIRSAESPNGCCAFTWTPDAITRSGCRWRMQECPWQGTANTAQTPESLLEPGGWPYVQPA